MNNKLEYVFINKDYVSKLRAEKKIELLTKLGYKIIKQNSRKITFKFY